MKEFMKDRDFSSSLINGQDFIKGEVQRVLKEKDDENKDSGG